MGILSVLTVLLFLQNFKASLGDAGTSVCIPPTNTKCFNPVTNLLLNWYDAETYCHANFRNGHLASIHNGYEKSAANSFLPSLTTSPWIGAFRIGSLPFQWSDATPFDYTSWAPGQPTQNCVQICRNTVSNGTGSCTQGLWTTANCENSKSQFICEYENPPPTTTPPSSGNYVDCLDVQQKISGAATGYYLLSPPGVEPFRALCNMDIDGGGWTVFQQRQFDHFISFYDKTWNEYKNGFSSAGGVNASFWLGNDRIHALTAKDINVELRIDIIFDRNPSSRCRFCKLFEKYSSFAVDDESHKYLLTVIGGSGNATDYNDGGMYYYNNNRFYTMDVDNSGNNKYNCSASNLFGGWWYAGNSCGYTSLNGKYYPDTYGTNRGFTWNTYNRGINPYDSSMMLRKTPNPPLI